MKLHVLFMQRKEAYLGEYAPEVLDAVTEFQAEENEELLLGLLNRHSGKLKDEAVGLAWVTLDVSGNEIRRRLVLNEKVIPAKIV